MSVFYPSVMPSPVRLADGSVLAQDGSLIPFAASCRPDTAPDPATLSCVPWPGARNVNYECGGALVPLAAPGCGAAPGGPVRTQAMYEREQVTADGIRPAWAGCHCEESSSSTGTTAQAEPGRGRSRFDERVACFVLALAVGAAVLRLRE